MESVRAIVEALLDADAARADQQPQPLDDLLETLGTEDAPRTTFEWLLSNGAGVPTLVSLVVELAPLVRGSTSRCRPFNRSRRSTRATPAS